ncbi:MAG: dihydrolipoyl dehydrogenase [Planctomycetes bacterium]|nr:dihydrolipoyl dehydrogenase [Planctomycetota bacterium]
MQHHDLIVIGAGPGGYVAALRAAQLGLNVACVEKESRLGGTCLRVGCIPSKALLESSELYSEARHGLAGHGIVAGAVTLDLAAMLARKDGIVDQLTRGIAGLLKKGGITRYEGLGRLAGAGRVDVVAADGGVTPLSAVHVLIATGSTSATLPGIELDPERVCTSTEALAWPSVPGHLVVIGAGAIGLELGSVWCRLGAKVTVLEYLERILPANDAEIAKDAQRVLAKQGLSFKLGVKVTGARATSDGALIEIEGHEPLRCDRVLVAVGRRPNTAGLALEQLGIALDPKGRIPVDAHYRTQASGVYAIGDVIPGPMLAHKAEDEGVACVEHIVTGYGHVNYDTIPNIVYTHPEVAGVGKTEEELVAAGVPYRKGAFPFLANGLAKALGSTQGKVKILAHRDTDRILGVHILGPRAGDLIAEAVVAMEFGASSEDLARTCHAHPTLAECVKEAALAVDGRALHI